MQYITPEDSVILDVLAAEVDFSTCESIVMSQEVDQDGDRTLAVVTKVDRAPDGLYEKIQSNSVRIGLGYVCVKNKTDVDGSHAAARLAETGFFHCHPELSRIETESRGIPALAQRLSEIQAKRVAESIPRIRQSIQKTLIANEEELQRIPFSANSDGAALAMISSTMQKRRDFMTGLIGGRYGQLHGDISMHYAARLNEKFNEYEAQMRGILPNFLGAEYTKRCKDALKEVAGISLPNMLDHAVLRQLVQEMIDIIEGPSLMLVEDCFSYAAEVQKAVITKTCSVYPNLNNVAQLQALIALKKAKDSSIQVTKNLLLKERRVILTLNHYYMDTVSKIHKSIATHKADRYNSIPSIDGFSSNTASLADLISNDDQAARDLQVNVFSYVKVVHKRLCDVIAMEIRMSLEDALVDDTDAAIWGVIQAGNASKLAALKVADQQRRVQLEESVTRLRACEATLLGIAFDSHV
ncbi:unnamed protein product [Closterium sp. NIES-54]